MRIGINVPNDLLNRVKALQPQVNISQVCREALTKLADNHDLAVERVARSGITLERAAEFAELQPVEPDWVGYGLEDAAAWVSKVSPEDWDDFWEMYDEDHQDGMPLSLAVNCFALRYGGKDFSDRWSENTANWGFQRANRYRYPELYDSAQKDYLSGWLAFVREVRRRQKEHFEVKYQELRAEWDRANQARWNPQPPPQILDQPGYAATFRQDP